MATKELLGSITLLAAADFSTTGQYRFGKVDANGRVALTTTDDVVAGVIQDNVAAIDRASQVGIEGVTLLELGGTVTAGDQIKSSTNGLGITGTTNPRGIALESGVANDIISVLLR